MILKQIIISLLTIAVVVAQGRGETRKRNQDRDRITMSAIEREKAYQLAQAVVLGKTLAKQIKKKSKCLVIHYPLAKNNQEDLNRIVAALKAGLGDKAGEMKKAAIKDLKGKNGEIAEEAMMENTAADFNKVIKANKDCDVVITMVPLPFSEDEIYAMDIFKMIEDPDNPAFWIKDPKIKYPVFGIYNGFVGNLEPLFLEQLIHAMTMWKPNPLIDEKPVPKNEQQAFDKRYTVVTPDNIEEVKKKYPQLFPKAR